MAIGGMTISVRVDDRQSKQITRLFEEFPKQVPKVAMRAINRAAAKANTLTLRAITKHINIKRKDIAGKRHRFGGVVVRKATQHKLRAEVNITGQRIPLVYFKARQLKGKRAARYNIKTGKRYWVKTPGSGVSYRIIKGGAQQKLKMAFMARGKITIGAKVGWATGYIGVFKRRGRKRLPLQELRGPSIPHVAENLPALQQALDVDVSDVLTRRLDHEIERLMLAKSKQE